MNNVSCDRKSCINNVNDKCTLPDPEKVADSCLDFEDAEVFYRLKADAIKGTLG